MVTYLIALLIDAVATVILFVAVTRTITTPRQRFAHGTKSKVVWITVTFFFAAHTGLIFWPYGALITLWHTHHINRRRPGPPQPEPLPWATGTAPDQHRNPTSHKEQP